MSAKSEKVARAMAGQNTDLFCPQCKHWDMYRRASKCKKGHWKSSQWPAEFLHLLAEECEDYEAFVYELHAPHNVREDDEPSDH